MKRIRSFFDSRGYIELDTPLLSDNLIPESCLEVFQTERVYPRGRRQENRMLYLIPSPEIHMKKFIAEHRVNVYQICKCFRNGESCGHLHDSEFTMLEYYTMDAGYMESLELTEELFNFIRDEPHGLIQQKILTPFNRITMKEAFKKFASVDLFEAAKDIRVMEECAGKVGLDPQPGMSLQRLYDLTFIHAVEPRLKMDKPSALLDYPAFVPCLAKPALDRQTVERWELYYDGIELANCYSEETDPEKVKQFFINEEAAKKSDALVNHKVDHDYWKIFAGRGFPRCSGTAMGVDRLIMALTGRKRIDDVKMTVT
ncbi:MAG: LysR family transcriptional regulator [Treponema sp.]|nr:LysR family transcriptional regulator [Treponema sp.]